jgi:hypothetical protein
MQTTPCKPQRVIVPPDCGPLNEQSGRTRSNGRRVCFNGLSGDLVVSIDARTAP